MIKNKKTEDEKQLIKFRNQLHNLLIKYPKIKITGDLEGDVVAFIPSSEWAVPSAEIYLPTSGKQEQITQ